MVVVRVVLVVVVVVVLAVVAVVAVGILEHETKSGYTKGWLHETTFGYIKRSLVTRKDVCLQETQYGYTKRSLVTRRTSFSQALPGDDSRSS